MKKILFTLNHIEPQNGVCSVLKTLSGALAKLGFDVTVMPLFRYDEKYAATFDSRVKIKKCYGKYSADWAKSCAFCRKNRSIKNSCAKITI